MCMVCMVDRDHFLHLLLALLAQLGPGPGIDDGRQAEEPARDGAPHGSLC